MVLMDAPTIKLWVESLGLGFTELVADGKIPDQPLVKSFEDSDWPTMHPVDGVELLFSDTTKSLKQILITFIPTVGQPVYTGGLPTPFSLMMNQQGVRSALGEPMESRGRARLPGGLGIRGGWDAYRLPSELHPSAKIIISYLESFAVNNISFSLIN
ncbi:pyocin immunity protein [Pseudomonas sp. EYE_354]|nr:pyocin immunity protein [Pseudomonas sp. EYE_354]